MVGIALTTLRLHRAQILATLLVVLAVTAAAEITGALGAADISASQLGGCLPDDCAAAGANFRLFAEVLPLLALLPAVIGAFWGAPLVSREYETGTAKLAWTQSVSRRTWLLNRMAVLAGLLALCGAALGAAVDYWISVFDGAGAFGDHGQVLLFGQLRGWNPVAWLLLGFTLGALCGAALRRTVLAMAVTAAIMVAFTVLRNLLMSWVAVDESLAGAVQLQRVEVVALILVSFVLAALTCSVVQRTRF